MENHPQEELRLFLASQVAAQYLQRTLTAIRTRETGLESALKNIERKVRETHSVYEKIRIDREKVELETKNVSEEIAECDRLLKTTNSPPRPSPPTTKTTLRKAITGGGPGLKLNLENEEADDMDDAEEDDESPWEDSRLPRTVADHHIRSSLVFSSGSSPMAKSSAFPTGFHHEANSPKYSRSRTSSGTSGGVDDDDLVLFASNSAQNWFYDRTKDTISIKTPLEGITEGSNDNIEGDIEEENDEFF